ncbi:hypothetical protein [Sphingomonas sp. MMS24-J13]|uniref:hypothetical protein n=1 Tax=Sphingomonas sp. MMS24-J13 TaxID=3238686 RepID=UPI00384F43C8
MALADLTSVAAVKSYCGVEGDADDVVIATLVTACSAWIRAWLNRDITTASYDIRRSGRGTAALQLPQTPIRTIATLEVDGQPIPAQAAWGLPGFYHDDNQVALVGQLFTRGIANIRIRYDAGYDVVPADIRQACNELVTLRYKLRDKAEWSSKSLAGETVSLVQKDMPASVATLLQSWQTVVAL